jgi:hypothetical protein
VDTTVVWLNATRQSKYVPPFDGASAAEVEIAKSVQTDKGNCLWWYLRAPFNDPDSKCYFDRALGRAATVNRKWKGDPQAALYELLRRHWKVGEALIRRVAAPDRVFLSGHPVLIVLQDIALKRWKKLSPDRRNLFRESIQAYWPGKGQDLTKGVVDITGLASEIDDSKTVDLETFSNFVGHEAATQATRNKLIFAISQDFQSERQANSALQELRQIYLKHFRRVRASSKRDRQDDWLSTITEFQREIESLDKQAANEKTHGIALKSGSKICKKYKELFADVSF